jgi:hypothetical protein
MTTIARSQPSASPRAAPTRTFSKLSSDDVSNLLRAAARGEIDAGTQQRPPVSLRA